MGIVEDLMEIWPNEACDTHLGHLKYVTTAPWPRHPNSHNSASCGTVGPQYYSALFLNVSHELLFHSPCCAFPFIGHTISLPSTLLNLLSPFYAFSLTGRAGLFSCCAFCGLATYAALSSFFLFIHNRHSLHLCPCSLHSKHSTSATLICLIVLSPSPHYITLLFNTSNLFWGTTIPFFSLLLFLQFRARCPNSLQHLHNFPFLPFNSALILARARFSLSRLLMRVLYWVWDIMATSLRVRI